MTRRPPIREFVLVDDGGIDGEKKYLVLVCRTHVLHNTLSLRLRYATLFGDDLDQNRIDFTSHNTCITTHIEIGFSHQQVVDLMCLFHQSVLDVDLLSCFPRECCDQGETVPEILLVFLILG